MRKSFDTLVQLVREETNGNPESGSWFVFHSKRGNRLRILYWDGDGDRYALWPKRLAVGTFELPAVTAGTTHVETRAADLAMILSGVALSAQRPKRFVRPTTLSAYVFLRILFRSRNLYSVAASNSR